MAPTSDVLALQTEAYAANPSNSRLAERVIILWRSFITVNTFYTKLKVNDGEDTVPSAQGGGQVYLHGSSICLLRVGHAMGQA